jgi:hypothetical protein
MTPNAFRAQVRDSHTIADLNSLMNRWGEMTGDREDCVDAMFELFERREAMLDRGQGDNDGHCAAVQTMEEFASK